MSKITVMVVCSKNKRFNTVRVSKAKTVTREKKEK
jgi:hypothetical protein